MYDSVLGVQRDTPFTQTGYGWVEQAKKHKSTQLRNTLTNDGVATAWQEYISVF